MAPQYMRNLSVGKKTKTVADDLQTKLVKCYPDSGHFVEQLTLFTDIISFKIIINFLNNYRHNRKLKYLCLALSPAHGSLCSAGSLPYLKELWDLVSASLNITRLSFQKINPCSSLISAGTDQLTRLDIGHIYPFEEDLFIPFPPKLLILSITPVVVRYLSNERPSTLRTLIISPDDMTNFHLIKELVHFIEQFPSLTNIAVIDNCS